MIWHQLARFILRYRAPILILISLLTIGMGYFAMQAKMRYDLTSAIPADNPEYIKHQAFKKTFGEDGTMLVIGFSNQALFEPAFFQAFSNWQKELGNIEGVESVLSIPSAIQVKKQAGDSSSKLISRPVFQSGLPHDTAVAEFLNLPFYRNLLYNPATGACLTAVYLDADVIRTPGRVKLVKGIRDVSDKFAKAQGMEIHYSGLPYIRTEFAENVKYEMRLILIASLLLTSLILFFFFRSFSAVIFSVLIVFSGVLWAIGILHLFDYKISILTALIAPLVVVIGIPNCIYFLNKYHTEYAKFKDKKQALISMVERMGVVTLFTNLTAAIGFGVFYFTRSQVLKEFGLVAGISILVVFLISLFSIPSIFSYLPVPKDKHTRYLENKTLSRLLLKFEFWVTHHRKTVLGFWAVLIAISVFGMLQLRTVGHIVDDLPKDHALYRDLKYFEKNFHGVMPLEIMIDTKKKNGAASLATLQKMDELSTALKDIPQLSKPLSIVEAIKFARQAYYDGDSSSFAVPNSFDIAFLLPYLRMKTDTGDSQFSRLIKSFVDSSKQIARISVGIEDVGSVALPELLKEIDAKARTIFDPSRYNVTYTGTSIVFLEGSKYIINSLRDSLLLALVMIIICMIFLFRTYRVVLISIVTNIIPLAITAGVMGFFRIPLKPSTVLVFSIALGIAIDVTIRFLVNYKQDLPKNNFDPERTVQMTIQETGISIIYTSLILAAGFVVFLVSKFEGTQALGYLTALTLFMAMITNLTILPVLLVWFDKPRRKKTGKQD